MILHLVPLVRMTSVKIARIQIYTQRSLSGHLGDQSRRSCVRHNNLHHRLVRLPLPEPDKSHHIVY